MKIILFKFKTLFFSSFLEQLNYRRILSMFRWDYRLINGIQRKSFYVLVGYLPSIFCVKVMFNYALIKVNF